MKTLLLQIPSDEDYELFLNFANRLNCKIIPTENWNELDKEDIVFNEEMKTELERRLLHYENNPTDTYTIDDVQKELEIKFGRKL